MFDEFSGKGPGFEVKHEQFNSPDCMASQSDCDPVLGMVFMRGGEDAAPGTLNPAAIVCHGLRAMTIDELELARLHGKGDRKQCCDLEIRWVKDPL
jgi:hypothetical protein